MPKILVVDDDPALLCALSEALGHYFPDLLILTAQSVTAGISLLKEADVDLVIADILMPGMNGPDLLQEMERMAPNVPAIMMTGLPENSGYLVPKQTVQIIHKPFDMRAFAALVREALHMRSVKL
jgi:two-component system nitrogen regulation response regulator NtrX